MTAHSSIRGLVAVRAETDPNSILNSLTTAFSNFRASNDRRLDTLETALSDVNAQIAAVQVGPAGGDEMTALPANRRRAIENLGTFGRNGEIEALRAGFTVNAAMRSNDDPNGGYIVPDELSEELLSVQRKGSAIRRLARVRTVKSATFEQPISVGGTSSGWVSETSARPQTDGVRLRMIEIPAGEIYAMPAVTQNLLDDNAFSLGDFIANEIANEFNDKEGGAFINGDGINKPRGFLTYPTTNEDDDDRDFGKLQYVASGKAAGLADTNPGDVFADVVAALKAGYRANATWVMNSKTEAAIGKLKDGTGDYLWRRGIEGKVPNTLIGYPVELDEQMPDIGAGEFPVAFGDWKRGFMVTDRQGVRILRDPFSSKPYVLFYTTKRVGGAVLDSNAIKLLKIAAS